MGVESHNFEGTSFEERFDGVTANTAAHEAEDQTIEIEGHKIKVFPRQDGSFSVHVDDTCIFNVELIGNKLEATNQTPDEYQGAWKAPTLLPFAVRAVEENYFQV